MNAVLRVVPDVQETTEAKLESSVRCRVPAGAGNEHQRNLNHLQDQFIDAWAKMATSFAMDSTLGRIHALTYISLEPLNASTIAQRLGLTEDVCGRHLQELVSWGLLRAVHTTPEGTARYEAEQDPWSWFLRTVRERHHREFLPLQQSVRAVLQRARELQSGNSTLGHTFSRIERFSRFIDEFARLIDIFVTLGGKPMTAVLKTVAKFMPRSRAL